MQAQRILSRVIDGHLSIQLPESFNHHQVEVIVLTLDDAVTPKSQRQPHPDILGRIQIKGDIFSSSPEQDWDLAP